MRASPWPTEPFPRLSYEQGEHNAFYFAEELESTRESTKDILVRDRATLFNLTVGLDGYTISSGVIDSDLYGPNIVAVPLEVDDAMEIGYITHTRVAPGSLGERYIEELTRTAETARRAGKARWGSRGRGGAMGASVAGAVRRVRRRGVPGRDAARSVRRSRRAVVGRFGREGAEVHCCRRHRPDSLEKTQVDERRFILEVHQSSTSEINRRGINALSGELDAISSAWGSPRRLTRRADPGPDGQAPSAPNAQARQIAAATSLYSHPL